MKYGIVIYKNTDNIGDDILSYAASRLMPKVDYYIDREEMDLFCPERKEKVALIMNGWYLYHKYNWPPSPYIYPLLTGIHLSKNDYLGIEYDYIEGQGKEFFLKSEPIGCRDSSTREALIDKGIKAYFSGCLTLTLGKLQNVIKNNKIYLVDIPKDIEQKIINDYDGDFEIMTHNLAIEERDLPWDDRKVRVETTLRKYQGASCVVTSRLHVALPCLALETPVLLIYDAKEDNRFSDYLPLLHYCTKSEFLKDNIQFDMKHPPTNKETYKEIRKNLIDGCKEFVRTSAVKKIEQKELPEIKDFIELWVERAKWQKQLLANKRDLKEQELIKERQWTMQQEEIIHWLKDQIHSKDLKNEELEEQIVNLQAWLKERNDAIDFLNQESDLHKGYISDLENQILQLNNRLNEITKSKLIKIILKIKKISY